jgi:hypothetical protein
MPLTYGLKTAKDLFQKLQRDADLLGDKITSDRFFNFVVTAYSLIDWIQEDPSVPATAKAALLQFRTTREILICRDLANASKHFQLSAARNRNPSVIATDSEQGFDIGRYDAGNFEEGEEAITVDLSAGGTTDALQIVRDVLSVWNQFFTAHNI